MGLKAGIVGLPNVGKSTLFNAITNSHVEAANYPFATINPNNGIVMVPDQRLDDLTDIFHPKKKINATFEFYDIAGLVRGASKGEGLGNQFLAHIRECDAIVEVVRCFDSNEIIHVDNTVDPKRDIETINLELVMADLETIQKRIDKVANKARVAKDKLSMFEMDILNPLYNALQGGLPARSVSLSEEQRQYAKVNFGLLTLKPIIYVANVSENDYANVDACEYYQVVKEIANSEGAQAIPVSCEIESQLSELTKEEKEMFLTELGATESGLDKVIKSAYKLLNLRTFFTVGEDECRAWTFKEGMLAPQCAGVIHTDFEKGFIKAEVYTYDDIMKYKTELGVKEAGKLRMEGKDYVAKDGDIMHFRFNV
ncbi:MAG: redox-regulated ATPase YchF [Erysipelotrichales bacterium]|nr:redox-regulated ATPase YchF [Erysipelotrichales bacterium]